MSKKNTTLMLFLLTITILIIIGLIFIYSSSSIYAFEKTGSSHYFVKKQLIGFAIGLGCLTIALIMPLKLIKQTTPLFFLSSLGITVLTVIPGVRTVINGSSRWLMIKGFSFQPSELLKIAFLLYMAYFLEKKKYNLKSFTQGYIPLLCIIGICVIILLKQPDFGQAVTLTITGFILYFVAQGSLYYLTLTALPAIIGATLLIALKPYRVKRILVFLNPWNDPQGAGFQIIQSLIAIGSGKFWGLGITQSKQKFFYLPMQHTDFIFSIIAEESGFIGATIVILLYCTFLFLGLKLAWNLKNTFSQLVTLGFVILVSLQTLINIYVATGLAPTKGIGLPFISFGSSALLCNMLMLGIIINCVQEEKTVYPQ